MSFSYRLIHPGEQNTSSWSGGTTTELTIYPPGSSYAARDFQWRISTAVVTAAESTFTSLPGWNRVLMVLTGQMKLTHSGHHEKTLLPFEQDTFKGDWVTHCAGTGRDFNLMLAAGWQGSLGAVHLPGNEAITLDLIPGDAHEAFYCLSGEVHLLLPGGIQLGMGEGDFLLLQHGGCEDRGIDASARTCFARLVQAGIWPE